MDPRKLYVLLVGIIATAAFITILAGVLGFKVDPGFWAFLGAVVTFLGTVALRGKAGE